MLLFHSTSLLEQNINVEKWNDWSILQPDFCSCEQYNYFSCLVHGNFCNFVSQHLRPFRIPCNWYVIFLQGKKAINAVAILRNGELTNGLLWDLSRSNVGPFDRQIIFFHKAVYVNCYDGPTYKSHQIRLVHRQGANASFITCPGVYTESMVKEINVCISTI